MRRLGEREHRERGVYIRVLLASPPEIAVRDCFFHGAIGLRTVVRGCDILGCLRCCLGWLHRLTRVMQRGMTLAPRVQVYTQLSCNALYGHDVYDHTEINVTSIAPSPHIPFLHLDPAGPALHPFISSYDEHAVMVTFAPATNDSDEEPDPRRPPSKRCLQDPAVQKGAARLQTIITITMGTLSALTTGWWGNFGERHGRTRVLAVATMGLFLTFVVYPLETDFALTHGMLSVT